MRILLLIAGLAAFQSSERDPLAGNPGIPNYYRIRPDVAAAGQPSDEALADIQKAGFKTVINLRTAEEGSRGEASKVETLGLEYHNIQWGSAGITKEQFDEFEKILADSAN
ncbi:MAG TPA: sulfur transferase domain-containing protein, partial [Vicinamibacteria bacterium]